MEEKDKNIEKVKELLPPDVKVVGVGYQFDITPPPELPLDLVKVVNKEDQPQMTPEQAKKFAKQLQKYMRLQAYAQRKSKHAKGRLVSKEVVKKRIKAKKAKRRISNKSRKTNLKWIQK